MILHLAAGIEHLRDNTSIKDILKRGALIRSEIYIQAKTCHDAIGDLPGDIPLIRAELHARAHDACKRNHDKDNRLLLCFPPDSPKETNLRMINVAPSLRYSTHLYIHESLTVDKWVFLISYRNHMRMALPPSTEATRAMLSLPVSTSSFKGWESLLSGEGERATISVKALTRCPICQETSIRIPPGAQGTMVGKASTKEGYQIREFPIQDPWARECARDIGPDAEKEWVLEQLSPLLGNPPSISHEAREQLIKLVQSVPLKDTPFTEGLWDIVATNGDTLITLIGNMTDAVHCFVSLWRKQMQPTTMTPSGLALFKNLVDEELYNFAYSLSTQGALSRSHATPLRSPQMPYPPVRDNPIRMLKDLWPDVLEGRLFIFTTKSEELMGPLMETKLTFAEQKDPIKESGVKIRYICDPRLNINSSTHSRRHPLLSVPAIPSLLRGILFWKRRYPDIPVYLCKRDAKSAFKLSPSRSG